MSLTTTALLSYGVEEWVTTLYLVAIATGPTRTLIMYSILHHLSNIQILYYYEIIPVTSTLIYYLELSWSLVILHSFICIATGLVNMNFNTLCLVTALLESIINIQGCPSYSIVTWLKAGYYIVKHLYKLFKYICVSAGHNQLTA